LVGHIERIQEGEVTKKVTRWRSVSSRLRGRLKMKWEDDVMQDIQNCEDQEVEKDFAMNRSRWNEIFEQARTHQGF
jgi:hypothetical protein